ncbi:MAG: 4Fe-4S binding protein [Candidatus Bathyarchaeales archaeon]
MTSKIRQDLFKFNTLRRIVQFLSFILFSAIVFNLSEPPLLPILWTVRTPQYLVIDAFTALQVTFYYPAFPWLAMASFLIIGILLGKSLCGWICPFGFIQDLIGFVKRKKMEVSPRTHESMIYVKYVILSITLFISVTFSAATLMGASRSYEKALGIFAKAPFTTLSPAEILFSTLPQMLSNFDSEILSNPLFWAQLFIMVGVLIFAAYVPRGWCKYFCPHGAIMAILNRFSFLGLRRDLVKCAKGECRLCVEACPMNVYILDLPWEKFSDPECIYCLKCVDSCPNKAIKPKYP